MLKVSQVSLYVKFAYPQSRKWTLRQLLKEKHLLRCVTDERNRLANNIVDDRDK